MNAASDPNRYLVPGGAPHAVIVPARVARFLDRILGSKRAELRGADRELDDVLAALHHAGLEYVEYRATADDGSAAVPEIAEPRQSGRGAGPHLDAVAVAELLGCKPRNVRDLASRGRLHGDRIGGRWLFAPEIVDAYVADRATA